MLTIAIPTYNRSSSLMRCLESVICQIEYHGMQDICRVIVSDNCSSDDTKELIRFFSSKYRYVTGFSNDKNIGGLLNFSKVAGYVETEYFWFMGDDSIMLAGALPNVINCIQEGKGVLDFIFAGGLSSKNIESEYVLEKSKGKNFFVSNDPFKIIASIGMQRLGNISYLVYKTEMWRKLEYRINNKLFIYPQIEHFLNLLPKMNSIGFIVKESVFCGRHAVDHNSWYIDKAPFSYIIEFPFYSKKAKEVGVLEDSKNGFMNISLRKRVVQVLKVSLNPHIYGEFYSDVINAGVGTLEKILFWFILTLGRLHITKFILSGVVNHKVSEPIDKNNSA